MANIGKMRSMLAILAVIAALAGGGIGIARADNYFDVQQFVDQYCDNGVGACDQSYDNSSSVVQN